MLDLAKLRIDVFKYSLETEVKDNLSGYLLSTISNILALNYAIDKDLREKYIDIQEYASICTQNLKNFLQSKIILDETFDVALSLFIVAITPNNPYTEDLPQVNQSKNKSVISAIVGYECYKEAEISADERNGISEVIDLVLDNSYAAELLNLAVSNPEIMIHLLRKKNKSKDIVSRMSDMAKGSGKASSILTDFKQFGGLVACAALGFVANVAIVQFAPAIAAAAVVPISVGTLKYGVKLGEFLGEKISNLDAEFRKAKSEFIKLVSDFTPDQVSLSQDKTLAVSKSVDIQSTMQNIDIEDIAQDFGKHITTEQPVTSKAALHSKEKPLEKQQEVGISK